MEVLKTRVFGEWLSGLRDAVAQSKIAKRIDRLALGNPGDVEPVGEGVSEMRIHHGPGYRVYYLSRGRQLVILLRGGDKSSQQRDIKQALDMARKL